MGKITIVGLGPGSFGLMTVETLEIITNAAVLLLRTAKHPTVEHLSAKGIQYESYDALYNEKATFDEVYRAIAADCLNRASAGVEVVYAVPGSPLVAEKTVALIREQAAAAGVSIHIAPGMSFIELAYSRLGIDPIDGIAILDAVDLLDMSQVNRMGLMVTQVYSRQVASDAKISLMEYFPDEYPIVVLRNLGLPDESVCRIPLFELDRLPIIDHLTSVYVPPITSPTESFKLDPVVDVMARLRSPDGCVWDIEQNHSSLRRYLVEEVYEVLEAIDLQDSGKLCEELGDLLLQIIFHARVAEEYGEFSIQNVIDTVTEKMIRRHPHVFGDISVRDAAEVVVNWENIKMQEMGHERKAVLDGVPKGLPALMRAFKLQAKAAKVGFDWEDTAPVWDKLYEELGELRQAIVEGRQQEIEGELGDVLFAVVNLARFLAVEPEVALNQTNRKFVRRFSFIEEYVRAQGLQWSNMSLQKLDKLWEMAKKDEKIAQK